MYHARTQTQNANAHSCAHAHAQDRAHAHKHSYSQHAHRHTSTSTQAHTQAYLEFFWTVMMGEKSFRKADDALLCVEAATNKPSIKRGKRGVGTNNLDKYAHNLTPTYTHNNTTRTKCSNNHAIWLLTLTGTLTRDTFNTNKGNGTHSYQKIKPGNCSIQQLTHANESSCCYCAHLIAPTYAYALAPSHSKAHQLLCINNSIRIKKIIMKNEIHRWVLRKFLEQSHVLISHSNI